ncbi:MAG: fibronectin type III domain-containing protein [Flavobacteriaceae bacterium]
MKKIILIFFAFFAFNFQMDAQSIINITTSGGNYATEKWVSITTEVDGGGTQVWGQGDGTYGNGQGLINQDINLPAGTYFVNCYDRYSDGWDGTLISVTSYGALLGNNGGVSPSDSNTNDSTSSWETPEDELEASFEIVVTSPPSCLPPTDFAMTNSTSTSADFSWTAGATESAWNIEYGAEGFTQGTGTSDTATTTTFNLTGLSSNTNYHIYVQANCGGSTSNWVGPLEFSTNPGCGDTLFDSGGATGSYGNNDLTTVTVYPDDAGDLVTFTFLSFGTESCCDDLTVYDGPDINADVVGVYAGSTIPDPITSSHPTGALTFVFDSDGSVTDIGYEILVSCSPAPSCLQVSDLEVSTITGDSAEISWTANNGETAWEYVIQPQGTGDPTTAGTPITTNPYTITGLDSSTDYEIFVRAICSGTDSSPWRGPVNFTTSYLCGDTIFDSGGATGSYGNNDLITVTVYADTPGDLVTFTFLSFGTESCCDDLTVYDGPDINADVVGVYAGSTIPDPITSSHPTGALTFVFDSDGSVTDIGYEILVSCSPPPTCIQVSDVTATNATTTSVELGWTTYNSETLWNIEYGAPGFAQGAGTSIVANSNPFTLTGLDNNATYDFYIQADCGAGDTSAWVGPLSFTTLPVPFVMPGCFDFEDGILGANAALSSDIYSDASLDAGAAAFASDFGILLTGGNSGTGWTGGSTSTTETQAWVDNVTHQSAVSMTVDATAETVVVLTFDLKQTYSYGATYSNFRVTVDGTQIGATLRPTTASSDPFVNQYYDLSAFAGTSFDLRLEHSGKYNAAFAAPGDQSMIDNICITAPTCTQPGAATADAITTSTATINWTAGATETSWNIEYGPTGFTQGTGTTDTTTTTTYNLSGLDSNTAYHFYVQADCGTSLSDWVGPLVFLTAPSCGDILFDSGGATGNYANNESTTVTIFPENTGDLVTFTFLSFDIESGWDFLTVYNGPDVSSTVLGTFSGDTIPDPISSTDATGALTFVFESDGSVNYPGYEILISCAPPPSCYPPTALTISNVSGSTADFDWTAGTGNSTWEYVIVPTGDPAPTGSGTAATVTSTQFTGLDFETTYDVYVRADCGTADGYSTWSGPVTFTTMQQTNFTVDCASGAPVNINYCYTNSDTMFWVFTSTTGFPLSVTFNAGTIEGGFDNLTIYDGLDNTGTVLFNNNTNNTNDFTGLVVESTSTSMYIEVDSDTFSSCDGSTLYTPWDFDVSCKSCITQTVDFNILGDCEVSQDFYIEVDVSDLGSASSVIISDNLASAEQTVTSTGVVTFGPYTAGVNVTIETVNGDDDSCVVSSGALTFLCPPPPNDCSIIYAGEDTAFCEGTSTNLTATYHLLGQDTTSYEINSQEGCPTPGITGGTPTSLDIDDTWSDVIDLGFEFCFFGDTYSQILIGSNGVLSFELENAGSGNGYSLGSGDTLPNSSNSTLSEANIFGVGHDIDPSVCGDINYVVLGATPSRQFVVNYSEVCHFGSSCNDLKSSTQIILYESSNAIDVNIYNKPTCSSWNGGNAVVGVQNIPGTVAFTPPDRNTSVWDATDEFWRFTPSLGDPDFTIEWFDGTTSIGTGETVTVSPTETTTYTAAITYSLCIGGTATITDTVDVGIYPTPEPIPTESIVYSCSDQDSVLEVTVTNSDVPETLTYYWTYDGNDVQVGPDNTYIVPAGSDQIGEYFVTVIDERNCYGDTIITLVNGVTPQLENDTIFTKCINGETELSVNVLNADLLGSDLEYVWYVDGTEVQSGAESTFIHTPGLPLGFVEVVVVDLETTCEASTLIEVVNGVIPQLENNTVFRKCMNEDKELSVNVLNTDLLGSDLEYVWYVDGTEVQSGSDYTYTHTAGLPLGFVEAVVIDLETMCEASTLIEVASFMNADCVDIPQGLSPNGDGMNDCLVLDHLEASDDIVKAEIYNRYGVKVFELNDYTSQWCGQDASSGNSNSNDLLPVGTYFYVIQFNSGRTPITSWIYLNY